MTSNTDTARPHRYCRLKAARGSCTRCHPHAPQTSVYRVTLLLLVCRNNASKPAASQMPATGTRTQLAVPKAQQSRKRGSSDACNRHFGNQLSSSSGCCAPGLGYNRQGCIVHTCAEDNKCCMDGGSPSCKATGSIAAHCKGVSCQCKNSTKRSVCPTKSAPLHQHMTHQTRRGRTRRRDVQLPKLAARRCTTHHALSVQCVMG